MTVSFPAGMSVTRFSFSSFSRLLEPYYEIVVIVASTKALESHDVKTFFPLLQPQHIINLQRRYEHLNLKRGCGNPYFIHPLRCCIWASMLGTDETTQLLAMYHDYFEDFAKDFKVSADMLNELPEHLHEPVRALTNHYSPLFKELKKMAPARSPKALRNLIVLKYAKIPALRRAVATLLSQLSSLPETVDAYIRLEHDRYLFYLQDLLDYVNETGTTDVLFVKFLDRLDNTLSDYVQDMNKIKKLYDKNILLLSASKTYVNSSSEARLKFVFALLIERSLSQLRLIIKDYNDLTRDRGNFYGKQYKEAARSLERIKDSLLDFEPLMKTFFSDERVKTFIKNLSS